MMATNTGIRQPCHGMRDPIEPTVLPAPQCQQCLRWLKPNDLPPITPALVYVQVSGTVCCLDRLPA